MPEKIGSRRGSKIGPLLAESGEESFSPSEHMSGFSEASAGSRYAGPSGPVSCYGIGAGSCYASLLRTISSCYFQFSAQAGYAKKLGSEYKSDSVAWLIHEEP